VKNITNIIENVLRNVIDIPYFYIKIIIGITIII